MKKKIGLILLSGVILLGICGCNKDSITGKYKQTNYDDGYLTLYENGSCYWKQTTKGSLSNVLDKNATTTIEYDSNNCNYDYVDNEITIKIKIVSSFGTDESTTTCEYSNNTIDCGYDGTYSK